MSELLDLYRAETTERLREIASSPDFSVAAQTAARALLRERGVEPPPPAPAPSQLAPRGSGRWLGIGLALPVALLIGVYRLHGHNDASFQEAYEEAEALKRVTDAMAMAPPSPAVPSVPPAHDVAWQLPSGPLTKPELELTGTWVAKVGDGATRSVFMADKVMFQTTGGGVEGIVDAVAKDQRLKTGCVWLELFDTRKGIRRECALVGDEPSALDKTDPFTGQKSDLGTTFEWYWDKKAKVTRFRFDGDMLGPGNRRFRTWVVRFGKPAGDGRELTEQLPEHDYELPSRDVYEVFPGRFLGR